MAYSLLPAHFGPLPVSRSLQDLQKQMQENYYYGPAKEEAILKQQLENQYYGPSKESEIEQRGAQTKLTRAQEEMYRPKTLEDIARSGAQRRLIEEGQLPKLQMESKYAPLKTLIDATKATTSSARFGPTYEAARMLRNMSQANRDLWIANNKEQYEQIMKTLFDKSLHRGESTRGKLLSDEVARLFPPNEQNIAQQSLADLQNDPANAARAQEFFEAGQEQGGQPPYFPAEQDLGRSREMMMQQAAPQQPQSLNELSNQPLEQRRPLSFGVTPEQLEQQRDVQLLSVNQKLSDTQMNKRASSAVQLDKFLMDNRKEFAPRIKNAVQYAGALGRGKLIGDQYANKNPDAVADYDWMQNIFRGHMSNAVKMMEGLGSTESQRDEIHTMIADIDNIKSNPDRALSAINSGMKMLLDLSDSVFEAAEPAAKGVYRKLHGLERLEGKYTDVNGGSALIRVRMPNGQTGSIPADQVDLIPGVERI